MFRATVVIHAAGLSGKQADDAGHVGAGKTQIAAGHAADEEAGLGHLVLGRRPGALTHLQAHLRRGLNMGRLR